MPTDSTQIPATAATTIPTVSIISSLLPPLPVLLGSGDGVGPGGFGGGGGGGGLGVGPGGEGGEVAHSA